MEEKEWLTLQEAAEYAGLKRATIYNYLHDLEIKPLKFGRDRRSYISSADAKRLKAYKETPWTMKVETRKKEEDAA